MFGKLGQLWRANPVFWALFVYLLGAAVTLLLGLFDQAPTVVIHEP